MAQQLRTGGGHASGQRVQIPYAPGNLSLPTTVTLSALLVAGSAAAAERTLWLVEPLYPGQETLVLRTEQAISRLIPSADRTAEIVGARELVEALRGKTADLSCALGERRCPDPIDSFVASLGLERVVLIKGGQDETGYQYRVSSYRPASGELSPASASHPNFEKALLGALVKVVPLAATLEVRSTPPGAAVLIDEVRVGVTPLSTQVLPGERMVKLDLKGHQPIEEPVAVPARGFASFERPLERVPARITIAALPNGTEIFIDGKLAGKDKIDRGIQPGLHTVRFSREGYLTAEATVEVKPDDVYTLDKTLEPLAVAPPKVVEVEERPKKPAPPPAVALPPPPTETERAYSRKSYLRVNAELVQLVGERLVGVYGTAETGSITTHLPSLHGVSAEYGSFGRYFGLAVIGGGVARSVTEIGFGVTDQGVARNDINARAVLYSVRALQPQLRLAVWRATFCVQAGLEARFGQLQEEVSPAYGIFQSRDLLISGRATARLGLFEGFFLEGGYTRAVRVWGPSTAGSGGGFLGAGYAF